MVSGAEGGHLKEMVVSMADGSLLTQKEVCGVGASQHYKNSILLFLKILMHNVYLHIINEA